jgi:hypothetical protein
MGGFSTILFAFTFSIYRIILGKEMTFFVQDKFEYFSLKEKEEQKALKDAQKKQELPVDPNAPRVVRESELWVDKFSPKHFMELLSDEVCTTKSFIMRTDANDRVQRTNRSVLTWMKEWDPFVFNKPFVKPSTGSRFAAGAGSKNSLSDS